MYYSHPYYQQSYPTDPYYNSTNNASPYYQNEYQYFQPTNQNESDDEQQDIYTDEDMNSINATVNPAFKKTQPAGLELLEQLTKQIVALNEKIEKIEKENEQLKEKVENINPITIENINYKIQELTVEELSGNLMIGMTALGEVDDLKKLIHDKENIKFNDIDTENTNQEMENMEFGDEL
ncbi:spore germination protein GerPC [Alkalihalobacterium bogoriense]|uniref:spore germination protein GerPC n=1 Tax=Alkalihalobacterium bogoriense TaxID=246272 RepID=UPI00047EFB20|nr:spore germination protein GerPC [Alkalihalobacterium bogoriense]